MSETTLTAPAFARTAAAIALFIAALGGAAMVMNAAGSKLAALNTDEVTATYRSVPAQYDHPPWIKTHGNSVDTQQADMR
jgi:hypothetical protein